MDATSLIASHPEVSIIHRKTGELKPPDRQVRRRGSKQVTQISASIRKFGFVIPILVNAEDQVVVGAGRLEAAKVLGLPTVPTISVAHLTKAEQRAYAIADNRLGELSKWDEPTLKLELQELDIIELDFDLEIMGFEGAELEALLVVDPNLAEEDQPPVVAEVAVSRTGDVWLFGDGKHRLVCGDARDVTVYAALMVAGEAARAVITDPPYNLAIDGFVAMRGQADRREFAMGSGEMSKDEFETLLLKTLELAARHSVDGSIHYTFMDWRHLPEILAVGAEVYSEQKNMLIWVKDNAGMGAFYRSQYELVLVWKKGKAPHLNTFGLGANGRYRTNVLHYPGASGFNGSRTEALAMHPTVKPVALVKDLIRDVTRRGDIVLDPFAGSGTLLIAAHKSNRRGRLIEIDPLYVDVICRRWARISGEEPILEGTGQRFSQVAKARMPLNQMEVAHG